MYVHVGSVKSYFFFVSIIDYYFVLHIL
jgi:hypothetical protein